ncbi:LLM class flavin-dependent oxidoreductase [Polluticaenibacter yanchengensis]|uniref:LLM class flavin-dependent oxidoreductase n=1 Tax=Polluticaenibacter yanchengensis TaxID=3014562 RepID=A0ABT4UFB2_9BACT|nr:LLM class flavin-dependent oxidoreductase [Chitinophagaceae bacterium LY-5]
MAILNSFFTKKHFPFGNCYTKESKLNLILQTNSLEIKKMIIGLHLGNGYGSQPGAWRFPGVEPENYTSFDARVKQAQAAERGKFQFVFLPDGPGAIMSDIETESPGFNLDVMMTLAAVARETGHIGLVATGSTTFNEPFNLARQFKALDIMSHGRVGWNAITSSGEDVAANYGKKIPSSEDRYGRAHEVVQLVQSLWGSWGKNAWIHNQETGQFAKKKRLYPLIYKENSWVPEDHFTFRHRNKVNPSFFMLEEVRMHTN